MRKTLLLLLCIISISSANAQLSKLFSKKKKQTDTVNTVNTANTAIATVVKPKIKTAKTKVIMPAEKKVKRDWSKIDLKKRPADHLMIQFGSDSWINRPNPDTINTIGSGRFFNIYGMIDKPFKTDPHFSIAYGLGFSTDNIYFGNTNYVNFKAVNSTLAFLNYSPYSFKKFKMTTIYLEAPLEIRYYSNPEHPNKSWKFAAGAKFGILWKSYTKGKNYVDNGGNSVYGVSYTEKIINKTYINGFDVRSSLRVGYGNVSVHADLQLSTVIKPTYGPNLHTVSVGLTISGL